MSSIGGKKREVTALPEFKKRVGLFEARVLAINPTAEEYKDILNIELKEDSTALEYLSTTDEGKTKLRIDVWLEDIKSKEKFKLVFFVEDKIKETRDGMKKQYINSIGTTTWASDPNDLDDWFTSRDYRVAFKGEEHLYNFLRTWLGNLDYRDAETTLQIDWKKLMKGNVKDMKEQVGGELATTFVAMATIKTVIKDDESKEYQSVYNKAFLPAYSLKNFRLIDYNDAKLQSVLRGKKPKELKPVERFVANITGEYGCKEFYIFKDLKEYDADENLVASDKPISSDGDEF